MRFQRNVKIFRGGIDAAPFAGLFFVLVLVMVLFHTHVFFPGVPIDLAGELEEPEVVPRSVKVLQSGDVRFLGESYSFEGLKKELQKRALKGTMPGRLILEAEDGASDRLVDQVERTLSGAGIAIKLPGSRLDLPEDAGFGGAPNPVAVVSINLNGQYFFQHQFLPDEKLQSRLNEAVRQAEGPVTLLLQADEMVPYKRIIQLAKIARRAGVARVQLATRPPIASQRS